MTRTARRSVIYLVSGFVLCAATGAGRGQVARPDGMMSVIPPKAVFFLERRGHDAIREVFLRSNLGKMLQDEAIDQFIEATRQLYERDAVEELFKGQPPEIIAAKQKLMHSALKPFWYDPCAMYLMAPEGLDGEPKPGFICMPSAKYRTECSEAVEALMKAAVAAKGQSPPRRQFTYKSGLIEWHGVAEGVPTTLPADPKQLAQALKGRSVFMISWSMPPLLLVAADVSAAQAMETVLANPATAKEETASVKAVMSKTKLDDWAFRWHVDAEALLEDILAEETPGKARRLAEQVRALGLDKVRGLGGTAGYADDVFTHLTYLDAPGADAGLMRLFKQGGSYQRAWSMIPSDSALALAGQVDTDVVLKMLRRCLGEVPEAKPDRPARKLNERDEKVAQQLARLAKASDGSMGVYLTDFRAFVDGMMMDSDGPPVGGVLGLTDRQEALAAVEELTKLIPPDTPPQLPPGMVGPPPPAAEQQYRKQRIHYLEDMRLAVMQDRIVMGLTEDDLKAGIDAALDGTGGFAPGSEAQRLGKLAGEGAAVLMLDMPALAKFGWREMMQMAHEPGSPITSLPSTSKMVRMLGPEIVVFAPDAGGLLIKGRGKVPFATTVLLLAPVGAWFALSGF